MFPLFTLQSPEGPTPVLGPTPPWWTDEAERKGNKCVALGGIGMQLASVAPLSEAIPVWLTRTHTRGGIRALAGPRGRDVSLWPERKRRVSVFTEASCMQRHIITRISVFCTAIRERRYTDDKQSTLFYIASQ